MKIGDMSDTCDAYAHRPLSDVSTNRSIQKHANSPSPTPHRTMASYPTYDNYSPYIPLDAETSPAPPKPHRGIFTLPPITTPSRVALLKPAFLTRGTTMKFTWYETEKTNVKHLSLDSSWNEKEGEDMRANYRRIAVSVSLWLTWLFLISIALYLYLPCSRC